MEVEFIVLFRIGKTWKDLECLVECIIQIFFLVVDSAIGEKIAIIVGGCIIISAYDPYPPALCAWQLIYNLVDSCREICFGHVFVNKVHLNTVQVVILYLRDWFWISEIRAEKEIMNLHILTPLSACCMMRMMKLMMVWLLSQQKLNLREARNWCTIDSRLDSSSIVLQYLLLYQNACVQW